LEEAKDLTLLMLVSVSALVFPLSPLEKQNWMGTVWADLSSDSRLSPKTLLLA
jgi:hypothetical protein